MAAPPAPALAAELARLAVDGVDQNLDLDGPMGFDSGDAGSRRPSGAKIAVGVAVLTAIALVGAFIGVRILGADDGNASTGPQGGGPSAAQSAPGA